MPTPAPIDRIPSLSGADSEARHRRIHDQLQAFCNSMVDAGIFELIGLNQWGLSAAYRRQTPPYVPEEPDAFSAAVRGPAGPKGDPGVTSVVHMSIDDESLEMMTPMFPPGTGFNPGQQVANFRPDGSVVYINTSGQLSITSVASSFFYDEDGSLGSAALPNTLYIGSDSAGNGNLALWDVDLGGPIVLTNIGSGVLRFATPVGYAETQFGPFTSYGGGSFVPSGGDLIVAAVGTGFNVTFQIRAYSSQSVDLTKWTDSAGTGIYTRVNKAGYFMTRKTSAPADGDLATGEMALWFDSTAGAAKLKIKAKNASGTVVTGEVALT